MKSSLQILGAWIVALGVVYYANVIEAQPRTTPRPFDAYQSGGNCVYIVAGKYASFVSVVPVGPGGC